MMKLFLVKKLRIQKGNICFKKIYNCALDGLDTEPEPAILTKVGTGTVTFQRSEPEPKKIVTVPQHFHWSIRI